MHVTKPLTVVAVAVALTVLPTSSASAAPGFDPARPKTANPAQTCAFIAGYARMLTGSLPVGFSHSGCTSMLAKGVPTVDAGDPRQACAQMEAAGMIRYPYAFYADAPVGEGFPGLVAHDRTQCARALYAFHTLVTLLPGGGGA